MRSRSGFALGTFAVLVRVFATTAQAEEPPRPYQYTSLRGASDAEVLRFMAEGKSDVDREFEAKIKSQLPDAFWTADAKTAALAFAEANRTPKHRAAYTLFLDNAEQTGPPERCTITLADFSSRDYNAVDGHYFLRVDPHESYLAFAQSWSGGEASYNVVHDAPKFDFRLCTVSYEDARKIADVIWWLKRIQAKTTKADSDSGTAYSGSNISSSADGVGKLTFRAEGDAVIEVGAISWSDYLAERWSEGYGPEVFFNFAEYLIQNALPKRLGTEWSKFEPKHPPDFDFDRIYTPVYETQERERLRDLAFRFLDWFALDQEKISLAIVAEAARLTGRFGISDATGRLRAIEKTLPPAGAKRRNAKEVLAALKKLPHEWEIQNEKDRKRVEQQRVPLEAELDWHLYDRGVNSADYVRESVSFALRRLAIANDAAKLEAWALSKSEGMQWAMQRLAELDKKRYADVLETFAMQGEAKWARQYFDELVRVDVKRATALARRLPPSRRDALALSAFQLLQDAAEFPDEQTRVARIIKILENPKAGWKDQERAIDLLVPHDAPLRYPAAAIDRALFRVLDRERKADDPNFVVGYACRALARRGRTAFFGRIAAEFSKDPALIVSDEALRSLAHLAQTDPAHLNPQLTQLVRTHLIATNRSVTELFWAIWAADLRELQPDLQRLATENVEEIEDRKARSSGGEVTALTGRFHFARQIVSLWSEPDSFTRARLLIALAVAQPYNFVRDDAPERVARMKAEMLRAANNLSPEAKRQLAAMLERIDANAAQPNPEVPDEIRHKLVALAREALRL
jgi:RNase P/RNase MRP subunit POP5